VFIGRVTDLATIASRFDDGARIVTIVAPGGMGKTRLALRFAAGQLDAYQTHGGSGVWFCDLADARSTLDVCSVVAAALRVTLPRAAPGADAMTSFAREIARLKRVLLVLDNVEHIASDVAAVLAVWSAVAEQARFLVTSRNVVGVAGEHLVPLDALELPTGGVVGGEAVELFLSRAREVRPGFRVAADDMPTLLEVVRATDGIPLAIELCAAKARILSVKQLGARMAAPLDVLCRADDGGKHASMRRTILDSLAHLGAAEQRCLAACSLFHGGFSLEAAEAVISCDGPSVLSMLDTLVARSLVRAREVEGEVRFSLFETIREVAASELGAALSDVTATRGRYVAYYTALGRAETERSIGRAAQVARATLAREHNNLFAAFELAVDGEPAPSPVPLSLARSLEPAWTQRGQYQLALSCLERALVLLGNGPGRAAGVLASAGVRYELGDTDGAQRDLELAIRLAEDPDDAATFALACARLGELVELRGDTEQARVLFTRALERLEAQRDSPVRRCGEAAVRARLGHVARREGDLSLAERDTMRALFLYTAEDCQEELAKVSYEAGVLALFRRRYHEARNHFDAGLAIAGRLGQRQAEAALLSGRGILLQEQGQLDHALADHAQAVRIFHEIGSRHREGSALYYLGGAFLERGNAPAAAKLLSQSLDIVRMAGMRRYEALVGGCLAVAAAEMGERESAREWLAASFAAAADCATEPSLAAAVACHDVAVQTLLGTSVPLPDVGLFESNDDVRFALRVARATGRGTDPAKLEPLEVAPGGERFRMPGGSTVDLSSRAPLRRILLALAALRIDAPGEPMSLDDIVAAAWPGERIGSRAAQNRVRVALATLRKVGLRGAIVTGRGGYLIDPALFVVMAGA
jgi:predicted ATPase